jgi:MoxR-like ATPase
VPTTDISPDSITHDAQAVRAAIAGARGHLVDRELIAEVVALCAVAREHVLVIGAPGTAKSAAVRRTAEHLGGRYFEYLLGRFTEPNEIFGPVDLRRLRDGVVAFQTEGMLPDAEIAFLDEVFLGSSAILNTLLGLLNERTFRRGATVAACPIRVCVGASNSLPTDPALAAFADRFLARVHVAPVADGSLEDLLEQGWITPAPRVGADLMPALDRLADAAAAADMAAVRPVLATALRRLRDAGIPFTDRRAVRSQRLIAAAAVLDGRTAADPADLWVLPLIAPTAPTQAQAREVLSDLLASSANGTLGFAAVEFSRGPIARAERLSAQAATLLDRIGAADVSRDDRLRIEAALRDIDAGFTADDLPDPLRSTRARLVAAISG